MRLAHSLAVEHLPTYASQNRRRHPPDAGTYLGSCSMLATSAYPPRTVKSFRFVTDDRDEPYQIEKAINVAKIAYARRKREFEPADAELIRAAAGWAGTWES